VEKSSSIIETSQKPEIEIDVKAADVNVPKEKKTLEEPPKVQRCIIILDI
jgi:hypothetical protein